MNKKGYVIWITGFPGSGKSKVSSMIHEKIENQFGKTIRLSGDDLRIMLNLQGYSKKKRKKIGYIYHDVCRRISDSGVNILIDVVCLFDDIRNKNRKFFKNYIEIYIDTDITKIRKRKDKSFYKNKTINVWGVDLKAELPKKPDILIKNDFSKSIKLISSEILKKIKKFR